MLYLINSPILGIPSTELVFIRSVFQGTFVVICMFIFRIEDDEQIDVVINNDEENRNIIDEEGVVAGMNMIEIHDQIIQEEKKLEDEIQLLKGSKQFTYNTLSATSEEDRSSHHPRPLIIQRPFGTNPTMCKVVLLRGIIGGFGFCNYYYTLSTLPLGDATTLLSLYPIITIFLGRLVLGEEIKLLQLVAAVCSIVGATLISRPSFLFSHDYEMSNDVEVSRLGYVTAIIGSCCASGVIVLIRKAGNVGAHTLQLLFSWVVFGVSFSLLVGFIASLKSINEQWRLPTRHELPYVLGVCISGTSAHFLLNYAAKLLPATLAGLIRSSDIFWAYALEVLVLGQHPTRETYLGVLSVCFSLILVLISSNKRTMKLIGSVGNLATAK